MIDDILAKFGLCRLSRLERARTALARAIQREGALMRQLANLEASWRTANERERGLTRWLGAIGDSKDIIDLGGNP